jgi:Cof subfamily protein (haloacid dehalogenase superfamily)
MKYRLIAMDMDGTLLNSQKKITTYTKDVLKRASDAGVILAVCTGRLFASADYYAGLLGTEVPVIASNGAYIKDRRTNNVIYEEKLGDDKIREITAIVKSHGFCANYYTTSHVIAETVTLATANYLRWNESMPEKSRIVVDIGKEIEEMMACYRNEIIKMVVNGKSLQDLEKLRDDIKKVSNVTVVSSWSDNIEVMAPGVSKGNSVKLLAKHYGIEDSQVICFGDNENDISMIEYAEIGIAMGNATEDLKAAADYITDTNDNDGVAKAIEKFVLEV